MSRLPTKTLVNRAKVEAYLGAGATGPQWGAAKNGVPCRLDANERTTVQRPGGVQVVARAVAYFRDRVTNQSRITIDGQRYEVLDVEPVTGPFRVAGYKVALG